MSHSLIDLLNPRALASEIQTEGFTRAFLAKISKNFQILPLLEKNFLLKI